MPRQEGFDDCVLHVGQLTTKDKAGKDYFLDLDPVRIVVPTPIGAAFVFHAAVLTSQPAASSVYKALIPREIDGR